GVQGKPSLPTGFFEALQLRHDEMLAYINALRDAGTAPVPLLAPAKPVVAPPAEEKPVAKASVQEPAPRPIPPPRAVPSNPVAVPTRAPAASDDVESDEREEETARARAGQETREMVRVSAGLLEQLVNLAGESSIIRSRVEQGMNDFSSSLEEM